MYWVAACPFRSIPSKNVVPTTGSTNPIPTCSADTRGDGNFNQRCVFPFVYQGQSYQECTTEGWGRLWCAIEIDASSAAANFGACQCRTNAAADENSALDSVPEVSSSEISSTDNSPAGMSFGIYLGIGAGIGVVLAIFVIMFVKFIKSRND